MDRKILLFTLLILLGLKGFCQEEDFIFLKNGSIIKGTLSENDSVKKITTRDGSLWVFKTDDIARVEKNQKSKYSKSLRADVGFLIGKTDDNYRNTTNISFITTYSVPLGFGIYTAFGAGLEYFRNTYLPVVMNFRFQPKNVGFILQGGYSVPIKKEGLMNGMKYNFEPGFFLSPEIAYTFPAINGTSFTISAGWRSQRIIAKQINYTYYNDYKIIEKYNRLVLRLGYTFR